MEKAEAENTNREGIMNNYSAGRENQVAYIMAWALIFLVISLAASCEADKIWPAVDHVDLGAVRFAAQILPPPSSSQRHPRPW